MPADGAHVILSAHFRVKSPHGYDTPCPASIAWRPTHAASRGAPCCPATSRHRPAAAPTLHTAPDWRGSTPCLLYTHRPYPDPGALLAAADEASYDLSQADLTEALASECSAELEHGAPYAALLALGAAHAEYERKFGHAFVICLDGHPPEEQADQLLAAIRRRMGHEVDEERSISADELRRVAQARLWDLTRWLTSPHGPSGVEIGLFAPVG